MKLYNLSLFRTYIQPQAVETELLDRYYGATTVTTKEAAMISIKIREKEILTQGLQVERQERQKTIKQLLPIEIEQVKKEHNSLSKEYSWVIDDIPQLNLRPENYFRLRSFYRFYRDDFFGRKRAFYCKPCDEKVFGYVITRGSSPDTGRGGEMMFSFCFTCENQYYFSGKMDKITQSIITFTYNSLHKQKIQIRQRGGVRLTLDEMNSINSDEQPPESRYPFVPRDWTRPTPSYTEFMNEYLVGNIRVPDDETES